jgi:ABC-type transport system involved in multi-copper enzyme maturation permease subunit
MLGTIINKELKSIVSTPKFAVTFAACSILILTSVWVGIKDYRAGQERVAGSFRIHQQVMKNITWESIHTRAFRQPDPMQIFVSGVNNDIGRLSDIQASSQVKLKNSVYTDDPIFAVFRFVDFAFIVQMVLSLFAILFTYDAINGEREAGTLLLCFSNPIPRAKFILGKLVGSWLGLVVPLLIPILLAVLLVLVMGIPMTLLHWQKFAGLVGVSLVYFTFFIALGLLTSALTRHSASSFLISLVVWVLFVFIIPRVGVMSAGQLVNVTSVADMESRQAAFSREKREAMDEKFNKLIQETFAKAAAKDKTPAEREAAMRNANEELTKKNAELNSQYQKDIADYVYKLNEERRNQQARRERFAFTLSRVSPASSFRLAAMNLAETDIGQKKRAEDAMIDFRNMIIKLGEEKTKARGGRLGSGRSQLSLDQKQNSDGTITAGIKWTETPALDYSEVPVFELKPRGFGAVMSDSLRDAGLLAVYSIIAFSVTFVAFLRYDVR